MISSLDAEATIFSRSKAAPPPLIIFKLASISSAPSIVKSMNIVSEKSIRGIPSLSANILVASEVGMPRIESPFRTSSPIFLTANSAVEPVPRPTIMPSLTYSHAASAERCFSEITLHPLHQFFVLEVRRVRKF